MQIIRENEKRTVSLGDAVTVHEYDTHDGFISGGTAVIKGRYPARGYVMNQKLKELVYVLDGAGKLVLPNRDVLFAKGDVIFLDHKEKYAWEGDMVLFMATAPSFDPAQHVEVD